MQFLLLCLFMTSNVLSLNTYTWGFNPRGTHYQPSEITSKNVETLTQKWKTMLCGPIVSFPSVVGDDMWVGDFGGCLTRLDKRSGQILWQKNLTSDYGLREKAFSRNTPTYHRGILVIPQSGRYGYGERSYGVWLMGVNATNGALIWKTQVSNNFRSLLTGSPNVEDGKIYIGLSSNEEGESAYAKIVEGTDYVCCSFGGRLLSYSVATGAKLWDTPTVPPELIGLNLYGGGAITNHPAIYKDHIYVTTANMYNVPQSVTDCVKANGTNAPCPDARVNFNAFMKFDKNTGAIVKTFRTDPYDAWVVACIFGGFIPGCPEVVGYDFAFIDSPMILQKARRRDHDNQKRHDDDEDDEVYVAAGQKSGKFWVLRTSDLSLVWSKQLATGSTSGGIMYASTVNDDNEIFTASWNGLRKNYTTVDGEVINYGVFTKLSIDGRILWERTTPDHTRANAALSSTNDVVFARTEGGRILALDAKCGNVKWSFNTNITNSIGGVTIDGDTIYTGTGPVVMFIPVFTMAPYPLYAFELA